MAKVQVKDREIFINIIKEAGGYNSISAKVGCSQTMLSLIAKGTRNPSPAVAINLCAVTGRKFDTIFFIDCNDKSNYKENITKSDTVQI